MSGRTERRWPPRAGAAGQVTAGAPCIRGAASRLMPIPIADAYPPAYRSVGKGCLHPQPPTRFDAHAHRPDGHLLSRGALRTRPSSRWRRRARWLRRQGSFGRRRGGRGAPCASLEPVMHFGGIRAEGILGIRTRNSYSVEERVHRLRPCSPSRVGSVMPLRLSDAIG